MANEQRNEGQAHTGANLDGEASSPTAERYVDELFPVDEQWTRVREQLAAHDMPDISVEPGYGRLLTLLVHASGVQDALEIGALGGYSGICLARGLKPGGSLVSLELKQEFADVARRNMEAAGFGEVVEYRIGDAKQSLVMLEEEGRKFDFFFIDADKGSYLDYLEWAIKLARPGAIIAADNTLLRGKTIDPTRNGPSVLAIRAFNERIANDERLIGAMLPAYDGLALAVVK
ncbi:putative O-methyltransferase YrrM [Paenibacillus cellulosilyticus]|uniref:Putative O-methyltransferase YrrM n=1 Tax=Paenibacillus cellulosilyticus TaxID=375489 RepID=A0A2V2Z056_9BACL|nr:O-methyltransferase [Paenibacillus cellulosilyticus]PWV99692.1 putative O-methyltransferase YrrM [Paenibacillus cellulosilyticus]QKS44872.1 O-methyltransferase [Paenibacillus cellulosilyticus]